MINTTFMIDPIERFKTSFSMFTADKAFFTSNIFNECVIRIYNTKNEQELKDAFDDLVKKIKENVKGSKFNYARPMIWDNWGLDSRRYSGCGRGGINKFGYATDTGFEHGFKCDINYILGEVMTQVYKSKIKEEDFEEGTIWKRIFDEDNGEFPGPAFMKFGMNFLGKIWLENMEPDDFKKLEIRYRCNNFFRNRFEKEHLMLSNSTTFPLMLYAIELIAKHNLDVQEKNNELIKNNKLTENNELVENNELTENNKAIKNNDLTENNDKIYLSDNEKFSEIHVALSPESIIKYGVNIEEKDVLIEFNSTLKDLILEFEKFITLKKELSDKKDILNTKIQDKDIQQEKDIQQDKDIQPEQTRDQEKQFLSKLSNEEFFKYIVAKSDKKKLYKINENSRY